LPPNNAKPQRWRAVPGIFGLQVAPVLGFCFVCIMIADNVVFKECTI
jgi:hypothetical protein